MNDSLHVSIIQTDIVWHNPEMNFRKIETLLSSQGDSSDLIVLPETFCTGFTDHPEQLPENLNEMTADWMRSMANRYSATVAGSFPFRTPDGFRNRMLIVSPDKSFQAYDKRHLFALGNEKEHYLPGSSPVTFKCMGWKIFPVICYDLRFPVWCRNVSGYDVMLVVANWPLSRNLAWETLLRARAIENQSYVVGVNRVGTDANGIEYGGRSQVVSPQGVPLKVFDDHQQSGQVILSAFELKKTRRIYPFLSDRDNFEIK